MERFFQEACFRFLFLFTLSLDLSLPPLADLNNIKFSAYRTAMKLRRVQKALRCTYRLLFMIKSEGRGLKLHSFPSVFQ